MNTASVQHIILFTPTIASTLVKEIAAKVMTKEFNAMVIELEGEGYYKGMLDWLLTVSEDVARYYDERYTFSKLIGMSGDEVNAQTRGLIIGYCLLVEFIEHSIKGIDVSSQNKYIDENAIDYNDLFCIVISPPHKKIHDKALNKVIEDINALYDKL